ncbi:Tetrathionate reductase subunit A [Neomoorella glycerini]|uniref:Tetrathionate reductase subunit A n=1 Tax=Neomoorella glycerini TaxID=55779 RepID=A0A6I5ZVA7_9FIRM|nr:molybdopterin-dependent oxidoreductase [Moorella glycerini]QGP93487.1 Tetrathionate reductase subunit A [Moorella glycerini]
MSKKKGGKKITRRHFLAGSLAAGGAAMALLAGGSSDTLAAGLDHLWIPPQNHGTGKATGDYGADSIIYTVCEQCNTHCTIKAVVQETSEGVMVRKITGNPYSQLNTVPFGPIPYNTPPEKAAKGNGDVATRGRSFRGGRTCLKGQAGIQIAYDRYRLRQPLKRVGPRGSGQFQTITWEQALQEILEGSPDLGTPGLRSLVAYVPQEPVMADWDKVEKGQMPWEEFDRRYKDVLIDTRHPDLGPRVNQVVNMAGDRRDLIQDRLWKLCLGSINFYHHGGVCGQSGVQGNIRSFSGPKKKDRMYADIDYTEYLIIWGTDPLVANKGPTWLAPRIINALQRGMKLVVIDPRLSRIAEKAHRWVPIIPGTDAALALGMARWIIEKERFDRKYLENPNQAAARADGEPTWSDATHLVNVSAPGRPKLRAADLGLGTPEQYVVMQDGVPTPHDRATAGDLEVDREINGIRVKSVFTLFRERVMEKTLAEYAAICGIEPRVIEELAREFTSHGKKAAIISYRGPAMHVNGYDNIRAINCLNHLLGNYDWQGGSLSSGARFKELEGAYDLMTVPKARKAWGIPLARTGIAYEKTSLFQRDGYPARRPWFPFTAHVIQEVLPSAKERYPYPIQALFIHRISPVLSLPGGEWQRDVLLDQKAVPLLVVSDVVLSETAMCADYVLPDLTYLERWGLETIYPNQPLKSSHIIQPVVRVFPEPRPVEDVYIDLFKALGLPGVGEKAFADGSALHRSEDFFLKVVANVALDGPEPVPDASDQEVALFTAVRQKTLGSAFNEAAWRQAVQPEHWRKVVYVLNRGGRFEAPGHEYEGGLLKYKLAQQADFYHEPVARGKNPYDGSLLDGLPRILIPSFYNGETLDKDGLPLILINWKARHIGTHRNISSAWLREIASENVLWMHPDDAAARGLKTGDRVKIRSASFEMKGQVLVTARIRPGVVGTCYNYGHTAYGSRPVTIDGKMVPAVKPYGHTPWLAGQPEASYAPGRGTGFNYNALLRLDPAVPGGAVNDIIGGSPGQLDTRVEVTKLS